MVSLDFCLHKLGDYLGRGVIKLGPTFLPTYLLATYLPMLYLPIYLPTYLTMGYLFTCSPMG
jgi:hypothetical protein